MKNLIFLMLVLTKVEFAAAYIPSVQFILQKSTSTTGQSPISIEQEVIFKAAGEELIVHENWLVEGDKNLKLSAVVKNPTQIALDMTSVYNNNKKTFLQGKNRIVSAQTENFYEKYLFIRSTESFKNHLAQLRISADKIRLSRADGRVSFALGDFQASPPSPQIWIDQDDFTVRKIRLPGEAVVKLSDIQNFGPQLYVAKTQVIEWAGATVTIKVKSVSVRPSTTLSAFYPQNLERPSSLTFSNPSSPLSLVVESFYKRFR